MAEKEKKFHTERQGLTKQSAEAGDAHPDYADRHAAPETDEHQNRTFRDALAGTEEHLNRTDRDALPEIDEHQNRTDRDAALESKGAAYLAYFREHSSGPEQETLTEEQRRRIKAAVLSRSAASAGDSYALSDTASRDKKTLWNRLLRSSIVPMAAVLIVLLGFYFVWQMIGREMTAKRSAPEAIPGEAENGIVVTGMDGDLLYEDEQEADSLDAPADAPGTYATRSAEEPETNATGSAEEPEAMAPDEGSIFGEAYDDGAKAAFKNDMRYNWVTEFMKLLEAQGWTRHVPEREDQAIESFAVATGAEGAEGVSLALYQRDAAANEGLQTFGYYAFTVSDAKDIPDKKARLEALFNENDYSFVSVASDLEAVLAVLRSTDAQLSHVGEQAAKGIMNQEMQEELQIWLLWK